ncbi:photosystem II cytochrome c-550 [Kamptonema animale CS-326]|jgi:photosystem II cytochrome c550|uniref:photosystem II cytochrome c-550 n=1 Tax=Kamptonema animale TaxID=92934 RepID=UPI00232FCAFC|nr:photosystem II cytochrome c-550 [Kamptonema animale]MDB9515086.1 photosystem II cytochrome c-550 [Kamptonema animale CS-326]
MLKRYFIAVVTVFLTFQIFVGGALAVELSEDVRTVPLNAQGKTVVLSLKQVKEGKRLFNSACAQCHVGGMTKTDPNVNLSPGTLALASPPRTDIEALVEFMKNPKTFDGFTEISELHPSTKSADIFTEMRNLTDDDLYAIAGHILLQPKIIGSQWGGGKGAR